MNFPYTKKKMKMNFLKPNDSYNIRPYQVPRTSVHFPMVQPPQMVNYPQSISRPHFFKSGAWASITFFLMEKFTRRIVERLKNTRIAPLK